jgi:hypothetical protein
MSDKAKKELIQLIKEHLYCEYCHKDQIENLVTAIIKAGYVKKGKI